MLAYKNRFHGYNALRYVYKNGDVVRNQYFTLKYSQNPRRTTPRIAVVISKKVLKGAVGRNRIRRRLYEQFRRELPRLKPHQDIVCIVTSSELRTKPAGEIEQLLIGELGRAGLYTDA